MKKSNLQWKFLGRAGQNHAKADSRRFEHMKRAITGLNNDVPYCFYGTLHPQSEQTLICLRRINMYMYIHYTYIQ